MIEGDGFAVKPPPIYPPPLPPLDPPIPGMMQLWESGGLFAIVPQLFASEQSWDWIPPEHALKPVQDQLSTQGDVDGEGEMVAFTEGDGEADALIEGEGEFDGLIEGEGVGEIVGDADGEGMMQVCDVVGFPAFVPQELRSRQTRVCVPFAQLPQFVQLQFAMQGALDGDGLGDDVGVGERVIVVEGVGEGEVDGTWDGEGVGVADGDGEADGDGVADGVALACKVKFTSTVFVLFDHMNIE